MANDSINNKKDSYIITLVLLMIFLGTCLFFGYAMQQKNVYAIEMSSLQAEIPSLNRQIYTLDSKLNTPTTDLKYLQTFQIYNLIEESASYSEMTIKSFSNDKKTNNLEITLIGNYSSLINFLECLWQSKFFLIKKIEIKSNIEEPKHSIEIHLKITVPATKGVK